MDKVLVRDADRCNAAVRQGKWIVRCPNRARAIVRGLGQRCLGCLNSDAPVWTEGTCILPPGSLW
jgi:hypothetical protein